MNLYLGNAMQFLTLSRRRTEQFSDLAFQSRLEAEAQRARTLYSEGFIRQIWQRGDMPGACLLIEAEDEVKVREGLESLPLVAAGMLEITNIVPLSPYRGFGPRF
ncbi:muconolactone Delta-isomerase family protein [Burkholderia sp. BCC1977]|uniref:muconolactone Delta-isomerase family protein n=1 Tax=Burkholderia sp. BCC1977 TaxID=2817440 RepID=UPI002ABE95A6|nr:muconolactone Delta-isomerase family protein [Burkholderia sp. BCC1977]